MPTQTTPSATPRVNSTQELTHATRDTPSASAVALDRKGPRRRNARRVNHTHAQIDTSTPAGNADRNHRPSDRPCVVAPAAEVSMGLPTSDADSRREKRPRGAQHPA